MPSAGIAAVLIGITIATVFYYFFSEDPEEEGPAHNVGTSSNPPYTDSIRGRANNWDAMPACSICLEPLTTASQVTLYPCYHTFHQKCIEEWKTAANRPSCPNCRCMFMY